MSQALAGRTTHFNRVPAVPWADPGAPFMWEGREDTQLYRCHLRGPYNNPCHRGTLGLQEAKGLIQGHRTSGPAFKAPADTPLLQRSQPHALALVR